MHSTLHELRLTQRALRSSCRQCSARCQSPRRAFHRGPPLRTSQEPGNNGGSNTTPRSSDSKQGTEEKTSVASSSTAANAPYLPHAPPSVRNEFSAPGSEQPATNSFYGSSWNRRQRVRGQQAPVEPPFVAPQWFYDHNVTIWGQNDPGHPRKAMILCVDEIEAASESYDPPKWGVEGLRKNPKVKETPKGQISIHHPRRERDDKSPQVLQESAQQTGKSPLFDGPPRYFIGRSQFMEIFVTTRGLLRMSERQQQQGDPAAQASNLILHYAGKNGEYMLDGVVRNLALRTGSDLLTLDVQDIADLISHAGAASKDPMVAEGRMLSYDILADAPINQGEPPSPEDEDAFDETESFGMPPIPGFGSSSGQPMIFGKPFTVAIDLGRGPGNRKGENKRQPSMLDQLFSSRGTSSPSMTSKDFVDASLIPLRPLVESLLSVVPSKRLHCEEGNDREKLSQKHHLPNKSTIVHVKDVKGIQNVLAGSQFLSSLYNLVESKRNNGESIIIIGTECAKDPTGQYSSSKIESVQRTPENGEISRTIVLAPLFPNKKAREYLIEDRKRRIATINLRHLWEMMRIVSNENFLGLEPGFWDKNIFDRLTYVDQQRLSKDVWSFQQVHRFATTIGGMNNSEAWIESKDREEGKITPVINSVVRKLDHSDMTKAAWSERTAAEEQTDSNSARKYRERDTARGKMAANLDKIRVSASKHEKRLMSGIVEPWRIQTTFKDVHAPTETIDALQTLTTLSLIRPEAFRYGVLASDRIPGLLLYGPPGTGKTLLAKAVARESSATMLEVSAADLNDMFVGEGEKNVKALFSLARKLSPCIVFLDEADSMFSARGAAGRRASHRELLNQFLKEWDGMSNDAGSAFLMVATNRPMDFDDAVLRRLPRRILVDLPTEKDREEILKIHLKSEKLAEDVDLAQLAKQTPFYSGSDLKNLCVAAALTAVREENAVADANAKAKAERLENVEQGEDNKELVRIADETQEAWKMEFPEGKREYPEVRTLTEDHFRKALEEITASVSEDMSSLKEIKKFDDIYGDKKGRKRKVKSWGFRRAGKDGEEAEGEGRDTVKVRE